MPAWFVALIQTVFTACFGTLLNRVCPPKTAEGQRADTLQAEVEVLKSEAQAKADAPTSMEQLIAKQKAGEV